MISDIQGESVSDPDNELLGTLLTQLYPLELPTAEIWGYLSEKGNPELYGRYRRFWDTVLIEKASDGQIAELLDFLQEPHHGLQTALDARRLNSLPLKLLARGLKTHGDELETERLYTWLNVGFAESKDQFRGGGKVAISEIRSWFENRPKVYKAVFLEGLTRCPESDEFRWNAFQVGKRLYGAEFPQDFGLWCLKQAVVTVDTKPQAGEFLLEWAVQAHTRKTSNHGLSLEVLKDNAKKKERLQTYLDRLLAPPTISPRKQESQKGDRQYAEEQREKEQKRLSYIRSNETALRENRAAPALLHHMAYEYFGRFFDFGDDIGLKAIEDKLLGDRGLIDAMLQGFRGTVDREDLPEVQEIFGLRENNRMHYLGLPFLAGLAEVERRAREEDSFQWEENRIRRAIAFYFCTPHGEYRPKWYRRLLETRFETVAEVQVQFAVSEFRSGREHIYKLWELAHDKAHAQVASYASLPLLRAFPTRCKLNQIGNLKHLLWAALQHADRSALQELIGMKLSRKSMNDAQRVRWLAVGVIVSPAKYKPLLNKFAGGNKHRISHLAECFSLEDPIQFSFDDLGIPVLELLIRLVGSWVGPDQRRGGDADDDEGGFVGPEMEAAWLVYRLIQRLVASPIKEASHTLGRLVADPELISWHEEFSRAQDTQRVIRRDAGYHHLSIEQVCQTLNGGTPANAADLAALMVDRFDEIAERVSTNNANNWRPYWNEDENQRPTTPKHENSCRDALLHDLRRYFSNAEPEIQYVNNMRADIRVAYGDFQVPVEIKKNSHPDLWSAPRNQLIPKYTTDPKTDGYGIYLVFWFGKEHTQAPPPSGSSPMNAKELKEQMEATLSPEEGRKVSVGVIDVSRPD